MFPGAAPRAYILRAFGAKIKAGTTRHAARATLLRKEGSFIRALALPGRYRSRFRPRLILYPLSF